MTSSPHLCWIFSTLLLGNLTSGASFTLHPRKEKTPFANSQPSLKLRRAGARIGEWPFALLGLLVFGVSPLTNSMELFSGQIGSL